MSTFVELEKQVQKNAILQRRIADLEVLNAQLERRIRQLCGPVWNECATCDGTGVIYPPAIFGEPVPDSAGEDCADCSGTGRDPILGGAA